MVKEETPVKSTIGKINSGRRFFIKTAALAGSSVILTGVPLVSYVIAPALKKGTGKWVDFGPSEDLEQDNFGMLSYEFMVKDGWLVLPQRGFVWAKTDSKNAIKVFSSKTLFQGVASFWKNDQI